MKPLPFTWDGEALRIRPAFQRHADEMFCVGETYTMLPQEERSAASHRHYFSVLNEAWQSLPEGVAEQYPTPEHLRKSALIRAGYCTMQDYPCTSRAEAERWALNLRREADDYALVLLSGTVVRVYRAQSQSQRAMGSAVFNESKAAVLDVVAGLLGVTPQELSVAA